MDSPHVFAKCANAAMTPGELYEAFEKLGPLPRYQEKSIPVPPKTIVLGTSEVRSNPRYAEILQSVQKGEGKIIEGDHGRQLYCSEETAPAIEVAKTIYTHAVRQVIRLRKSDPDLPPVPPTETDPFLGLMRIQEWCIDGDGRNDGIGVRIVLGIVLALIATALFEFCVVVLWPWGWLAKHPNRLTLHACIALLLFVGGFSVLAPRTWRKWLWLSLVVQIVMIAIQSLGH
ncbi:MAG: hypothetical protein PHU85_05625 [Phycisphaerae bacterium]|nr:hypothetical protein [Phycisphaerae bacterium]